MKKRKEGLTEDEQALLDEYLFYIFICKIFSTDNPIDSHAFLEMMCHITGCNKLLINTAVAEILSGIQECRPRKVVYITLLGKFLPVQKVCAHLGISMTTYYKAIRQVKEIYGIPEPHFDEATHAEITKLLKGMSDILPIRRDY